MTTKLVAPSQRERIVSAAALLLNRSGREAVSTRAVCAEAGVQSPSIYRHFADMRELLDAAASQGLADYLASKRNHRQTDDPVDDLRRGWDRHVEFALANPHVYAVLFADPRSAAPTPGVAESARILRSLIARIAEAGRLSVGVERAARMIHSATVGVAINLLSQPEDQRDTGVSIAVREAMLTAVTITAGPSEEATSRRRLARHAVALKALLPQDDTLSAAEAGLLSEWLDEMSVGTSAPKSSAPAPAPAP